MSARETVLAYVALGANLGDPAAQVLAAIEAVGAIAATRVTARSRLWQTAPVGGGGADYVNAVVALETRLPAPALLAHLQAIEASAGRTRTYRNAPRTLDLDLLLYGEARIDSARLTVPHPRLRERAFVLRPLAEVAPARVSAADLAAVAGQRIAPLHDGRLSSRITP